MALYPGKRTSARTIVSDRTGVTVLQKRLAHFSCVPPTVSVTAVHADITLASGGTTTAGITQPAVPCVLCIKGTGAGATGNVVLTILDMNDVQTTDTIALNGANTVNGTKVAKSLLSIQYPADSGATGEKVSIGNTKLIGVPFKLAGSGWLAKALFDNAADTGTLTADATHLYGNYFSVNGTPNSAKVLDLLFYV